MPFCRQANAPVCIAGLETTIQSLVSPPTSYPANCDQPKPETPGTECILKRSSLNCRVTVNWEIALFSGALQHAERKQILNDSAESATH